jgi:hypothetical protein
MKTKPIIFNPEMIRAILDGRKTQTRRVIKPQPISYHNSDGALCGWVKSGFAVGGREEGVKETMLEHCPFGQPCDLLWVRETIDATYDCDALYVADEERLVDAHPHGWDLWHKEHRELPVKVIPSIYMPRWASRITLEITNIRVERLQDISKEDAIAEGFKAITKDGGITIKYGIPDSDGFPGNDNYGWPWPDWHTDPRTAYKYLWESIYGEGSWGANPWVWVIEFKTHFQNIDELKKERAA